MIDKDYIRRINNLKKKEYLPKEIVAFLEKLAEVSQPTLENIEKSITFKAKKFEFDEEEHRQGKSLFTKEEFASHIKLKEVKKYLLELISINFENNLENQEFIKTFQQLKKATTKDKKLAEKILNAFINEDEAFYQEQAESSSSFSFLCYFLAYFAFNPFFIKLQKDIEKVSVHYDENIWHHGKCPYCASAPLLSYLKDKEGKRMHACSNCLAKYRVPRIQCPTCLESEQSSFSYFTSDTDPEYSISLCKKCNNFIKIKNYKDYAEFTPKSLLDDFESITLDIIAEQQGFNKEVFSLWI